MENKIHVMFNVTKLSAKKLVSPLKACNSRQTSYSVANAEEFTLQIHSGQDDDKIYRSII